MNLKRTTERRKRSVWLLSTVLSIALVVGAVIAAAPVFMSSAYAATNCVVNGQPDQDCDGTVDFFDQCPEDVGPSEFTDPTRPNGGCPDGRPFTPPAPQNPNPSPSPTPTPTPTQEPEPTEDPSPTIEPSPTQEPSPTDEPEPTEQPTVTPTPTQEPEPTEDPSPTIDPTPTQEPSPTDEPEPPVENIYYDVYADCFGFGYVYVDTYDSEAPFSGSLEVNGEVTGEVTDIELAPGEVFDAYFENLEVGTTLVLKDSEGNVLGSATVDKCPESGKIEFVERCGGFEVTNLDTDRFLEFTYGVYPIPEGALVLGPGESSGFVPTDITNLDYQTYWSDGAEGELMSATIEQDCDGKPETPDTPMPPSTDTPDDKPRPNSGASSTSLTVNGNSSTSPSAPTQFEAPDTGATLESTTSGLNGWGVAMLLFGVAGMAVTLLLRRREIN